MDPKKEIALKLDWNEHLNFRKQSSDPSKIKQFFLDLDMAVKFQNNKGLVWAKLTNKRAVVIITESFIFLPHLVIILNVEIALELPSICSKVKSFYRLQYLFKYDIYRY